MERRFTIVTEEKDLPEEENIRTALSKCGYPQWTFKKVKRSLQEKRNNKKKKRNKNDDPSNKSRGLVVLPYVQGISEAIERNFRKHRISTAMKPHKTIRSILVHPKDKTKDREKCEVVYKIGCKNCEKVYIGETGRKFETRLKEHMKDNQQQERPNFTRSERTNSLSQYNKSTIADHAKQNNHVIDWEGARTVDREGDTRTRQVKEAIHIKRQSSTMNRDTSTMQFLLLTCAAAETTEDIRKSVL